jgi:hypothetical protein
MFSMSLGSMLARLPCVMTPSRQERRLASHDARRAAELDRETVASCPVPWMMRRTSGPGAGCSLIAVAIAGACTATWSTVNANATQGRAAAGRPTVERIARGRG